MAAEKVTEIVVQGNRVVLQRWGHLTRKDAIAALKEHATRQREEAERALVAVARGTVEVYHQRGVHVAHGRVEVKE